MEECKLYSGSVRLMFDPEKHKYEVNGKKAHGVTSILGKIAKPQLIIWAAREAADFMRRTLVPGRAYDEIEIKEMCDAAQKAHTVKKDKSADIGHLVHKWIEDFIAGRNPATPTNESIRNGVGAFLEWKSLHQVEFLHSERKLYSLKYNYAGTTDFIAKVDGKLTLGDIKTGTGIYEEMGYQLAAYEAAYREEFPETGDMQRLIVNCQKDGVLNTGFFPEYEKDYGAFLAALTLYKRVNE